jgi:hypothetical protein
MQVSVHIRDHITEVKGFIGPVRYRPYPGADLIDVLDES